MPTGRSGVRPFRGIGLPCGQVGGQGPEGTAAFIGLVTGVVTVGLIMWAATD
jgi:hypothetical protein